MQAGRLLPEGEILDGELGAGPECRAQRAKEVQEQGEHGRMMHDAGRRLPCPWTWRLTDAESGFRTRTWRGTRLTLEWIPLGTVPQTCDSAGTQGEDP